MWWRTKLVNGELYLPQNGGPHHHIKTFLLARSPHSLLVHCFLKTYTSSLSREGQDEVYIAMHAFMTSIAFPTKEFSEPPPITVEMSCY